ncbi:6-phosphofructokinase [Desulfobulbus rhabdoformis]|uniref:ATP-dependent 6-phosphofructokinase n=1 Tax=Desulfobulbus rhabdoformis TaxID=34032 RepID=UPI001963725B|nr:ATP-dependent 6-phosphofructokinase [Desulfobulbus rhabdoformis]MBM9615478.1 6-phosphofructokinase [Desulfobulbus rhabdoformis]
MGKCIGVLTAGGDSPGLNAAIRAIGKSAQSNYNMQVLGFRDGFRGLMENRTVHLEGEILSGILTLGGTILGTSRDKPHKMPVGSRVQDMTEVMIDNYHRHNLEAIICIGGGGTQKNAYRLTKAGVNVITLPKTIDNDVAVTDVTFGFDTALSIATDAIDRLHSTAHSHHRIIVVEIMGHNTGWLGLGAGLASGADVILIPEIPYDVDQVAEAIRRRRHRGKNFSIVAVSEGALSKKDTKQLAELKAKKLAAKDEKKTKKVAEELANFRSNRVGGTLRLSAELEALTGLESRVTILGHLQRGGTPTAADRILATRLGTACATAVAERQFGKMVAVRGESTELVDLADVVGQRKLVPLDHPWIQAAIATGACLGNEKLVG